MAAIMEYAFGDKPLEITKVYNGGFILRSRSYADPGEMSCVMAFSPTDLDGLLTTVRRLLSEVDNDEATDPT